MKKNNRFYFYIGLVLILIAVFFLFWNLGGDATILKTLGDYGDEGYWLQNSVNKIRYGVFLTDDQSQSFFGAPIFNLLTTFQFKVFGISFFSARFISILFLLLTAIVAFYILKPYIKNQNKLFLYITTFLILFDNKIYYQWATPIPIEIFFQSLVILLVSKITLDNYKKILIVATLVYLAVLSKTTSLWLVGFVSIIYLCDNFSFLNIRITKVKIIRLFVAGVILLTPFFLISLFFSQIEPEKYSSFLQLLKRNIGFNKDILTNFINPVYYIINICRGLKFNNSFFLVLLPLISLFIIPFEKYKNIFKAENRLVLILSVYIITFIGYLIVINQFGSDRRQINLILPLYLISIMSFEYCIKNTAKIKPIHMIIFLFLFILISSIQSLQLLSEITNHNNLNFIRNQNIKTILIIFVPLLAYYLLASLFILNKKIKFLFPLFIGLNIIFHIVFINNNQTLKDANKKVEAIRNEYKIKYSTGMFAHHLSIESKIIPIWWLDKTSNYPNWNYDFDLFSDHSVLIITNINGNTDNHYFSLENIPEEYEIIKVDTVFLYKKMFNDKYSRTLLLNVCSKKH